MQFYMIDWEPAASAAALPGAMLRVNVREGWQIVSDIAHHLGTTFTGQYKLYSENHATTMRHRESADAFAHFQAHYQAALDEYKKRYDTLTMWHQNALNVPWFDMWRALRDMERDRYTTTMEYALSSKKMSDDDRARLLEHMSRYFRRNRVAL